MTTARFHLCQLGHLSHRYWPQSQSWHTLTLVFQQSHITGFRIHMPYSWIVFLCFAVATIKLLRLYPALFFTTTPHVIYTECPRATYSSIKESPTPTPIVRKITFNTPRFLRALHRIGHYELCRRKTNRRWLHFRRLIILGASNVWTLSFRRNKWLLRSTV